MRIHAVAVRLRAIATHWAVPDAGPGHAMDLLDEVRHARMQVHALWLEFHRVAGWLERTAGAVQPPAAGTGPGAVGPRGLVTSLVEPERLLAKDRLAADMNHVVAWLLQQVLRQLDHLPLCATAGDTDLLDLVAYGQSVLAAAGALDNAARMADSSERFIEELDGRWHALRDEVADAVAMARAPALRSA